MNTATNVVHSAPQQHFDTVDMLDNLDALDQLDHLDDLDQVRIKEINHQVLTQLITRVESAIEHDLALSVDDMRLLLLAITTLCTLQSKMEQGDITLHKLRKLLGMVKQSERRRNSGKNNKKSQNKKRRNQSSAKAQQDRAKQKQTPTVVYHQILSHQRGDVCPACQRGKLYKHAPTQLLRISGHSRYEVTQHVVEQLRCNGCQQLYKASLPASVLADGGVNQQYGYSARALMVIDKFYTGTPYYHQGNLATLFGHSISASTIFDQCEHVANDGMPVFYELRRQAANAGGFLLDDTHNRILTQQPELRANPTGKGKRLRTGIYTSGLIACCDDGHDIILYNTSLGHAGEHLSDILKARDPKLPAPLTMSDALSSNASLKIEVKRSLCNAHSRRHFFDLETKHPKAIGWLLDKYGEIWENEEKVKAKKLTGQARLAYHKKHSLPVMEELKQWALSQQAAPNFEEHSSLGKAISYFIKHYKGLTLFCEEPNALIDNNRMEEKLKIPIRGRKTSHFYKTAIGAEIANVLISLIATTLEAKENPYDYLQALQRHKQMVSENPQAWLPWTYRATLEANAKKLEPG